MNSNRNDNLYKITNTKTGEIVFMGPGSKLPSKFPVGYCYNAALHNFTLYNGLYKVDCIKYWDMKEAEQEAFVKTVPELENSMEGDDKINDILTQKLYKRLKYVKAIDKTNHIQCCGTINSVALALHVPIEYIQYNVDSDVDIRGYFIEPAKYEEAKMYQVYCWLQAKHVPTRAKTSSSIRFTNL